MKTRQFIRLIAIFAFSAIAFTACTKAANTNNSSNSNNSNNTSNMAANNNTPATPSTDDFSTPTATFKTFYEASKANNVESIKRSMSKRTLEEVTKNAVGEKKTVDDLIKEMVKDAPSKAPEMRNEKIDGEKATLEIKDDKMEKFNTVHFVKEDGKWKIAMKDESAAADMDKMDHGDMQKK